jgi:hypothetical protein
MTRAFHFEGIWWRLSLGAGVLLLGLAIVSCFYNDGIVIDRGSRLYFVQLDHGILNIDTLDFDPSVAGLSRARKLYEVAPWTNFPQGQGLTQFYDFVPDSGWGGFRWGSNELSTVTNNSPYTETKIPFLMTSIPLWPLVLATAVLPLIALSRYGIRRLKREPGHCQSCGYNLTGNTSGVCPECGTPVAKKLGSIA